jgi:hypothetical protein
LEEATNLFSEAIKEINIIQDKLNKINGSEADAVEQKFRSYFSKSKGFKIMCQVFMCIRGGKT